MLVRPPRYGCCGACGLAEVADETGDSSNNGVPVDGSTGDRGHDGLLLLLCDDAAAMVLDFERRQFPAKAA